MIAKLPAQRLAFGVAIIIATCLLVLLVETDDARALRTKTIVPGEVVVKLAPGVRIGQVNTRYDTQVLERFLNDQNTRIFLLKVPRGSTARETLAQIEADLNDPQRPNLLAEAELNFRISVPEADDETKANPRHRAFGFGSAAPTTGNYSEGSSYPESALNLVEARSITRGAGMRVAIIDTGAQLDHPALQEQFAGVPRYDFVSDDGNPSEPPLAGTLSQRRQEAVGHGTHVAGIVHLVAPKAELMPLRTLDRKGYGSTFHIAEATTFAAANGADVINLSLGTPAWSWLLREKVLQAIDGGAVVVAAAGNYNSVQQQYPASRTVPVAYPDDGLLAVASVNAQEVRSSFSNYGKWVDIAAPGEEIRSAYPPSRYAYWSGTSMATPFIAGQAALVRKVDGPISPSGIEAKIRCSARDLPEDWANLQMGAGHADIGASLRQNNDPLCAL